MSNSTPSHIKLEFEDLNQGIRNISVEIAENDLAETPLMRRNAVEMLGMVTPVVTVKMANLKTSFPVDVGLMIAVPIVVLAGVSYFKTLKKRDPYQDRGIELADELHRQSKFLKRHFPRAKWLAKKGCYRLPRGEKTSAYYSEPPKWSLF